MLPLSIQPGMNGKATVSAKARWRPNSVGASRAMSSPRQNSTQKASSTSSVPTSPVSSPSEAKMPWSARPN